MISPAWAGKLDIDYMQTSPTKAMVCALAFPGLGHYYLSKRNPKYMRKAWFFMALGLVSGAFLALELKNGTGVEKVGAGLLAGGVKIWEFSSTTDIAEKERLKWFKENFKQTAPEQAVPPALTPQPRP